MLAHRLLRTAKNEDCPIIDVFPDSYTSIPDRLLSSICAYVSFAFVTSNNRPTIHLDSMCSAGQRPRMHQEI